MTPVFQFQCCKWLYSDHWPFWVPLQMAVLEVCCCHWLPPGAKVSQQWEVVGRGSKIAGADPRRPWNAPEHLLPCWCTWVGVACALQWVFFSLFFYKPISAYFESLLSPPPVCRNHLLFCCWPHFCWQLKSTQCHWSDRWAELRCSYEACKVHYGG